ncbi:MAG: hypothetical protein HXX13_08870, partial [Bacteroidetes bacterium]|nr:hypothetical protein [Bacteroidota bacterium]
MEHRAKSLALGVLSWAGYTMAISDRWRIIQESFYSQTIVIRWSYDGHTIVIRWSYDGHTMVIRWSYD